MSDMHHIDRSANDLKINKSIAAKIYWQEKKEAPTVGLEPTTTWLRAKRSTD